jgi:hypothetical protein
MVSPLADAFGSIARNDPKHSTIVREAKRLCQGRSLFEDTKFGEERSDLRSVSTDCLGDIRRARRPEEADRRISDSGHYFGTRTLSDPACVLPERDVADVMTTILD